MNHHPRLPVSEMEFAASVDAAGPDRRRDLAGQLREEHSAYAGLGAAAVVRMRGWLLLALGRVGLTDDTVALALEELATGHDPYLVAAAARALRSYPRPGPSLAPFLLGAIDNIRDRDDPVSFAKYGCYDAEAEPTSPIAEALATLAWIGPFAAPELARIETLGLPTSGLAPVHRAEAARIAAALRAAGVTSDRPSDGCCVLPPGVRMLTRWGRYRRKEDRAVEVVSLEDQDGAQVRFVDFFRGCPSVVVFFYTRCDNPQKCSLTVTKLSRLQAILADRGLADRVRTAAITYDPDYDRPDRLRRYGQGRGLRLSEDHRLFRSVVGHETLRDHFRLGVNFSGSLVNRHRIEVFVLDFRGRIAASFERLHWSEAEVVDQAASLLREGPGSRSLAKLSSVLGTLASGVIAFFPKCPVCWATYLSLFGLAGLQELPRSRWFLPLLAAAMLLNLISLAARARFTRRYWPLGLASAGAVALLGLKVGLGWNEAAIPGGLLSIAGSVASVAKMPARGVPRATIGVGQH